VNFFERDFVLTVINWFESQRADLIILLFDAHKLDISDELKGAIDVLKGHEDKIRCILNKADQIDRQQLMRGKFCVEQFDS
jgi:50S ribosomal subunit-associated GTPase HflX